MRPLNVMHVMEATDGGTGRYLEEMIPCLCDCGLRVHVVCAAERSPQFRAAIIEQVGLEHDLFHNHDGIKHFHWDYPLIQYSVRKGCATIIGLQQGAKAVQQLLLPKLSGELTFGGHSYPLHDYNLKVRPCKVAWTESPFL